MVRFYLSFLLAFYFIKLSQVDSRICLNHLPILSSFQTYHPSRNKDDLVKHFPKDIQNTSMRCFCFEMDDIYTDFARKTTGWATNCSVSGGFSSTQVQQYESAVKQAETCGGGGWGC